jgi:hypothetical protein
MKIMENEVLCKVHKLKSCGSKLLKVGKGDITHPSPGAIEVPNREQLNVLVAIFLVIRFLT